MFLHNIFKIIFIIFFLMEDGMAENKFYIEFSTYRLPLPVGNHYSKVIGIDADSKYIKKFSHISMDDCNSECSIGIGRFDLKRTEEDTILFEEKMKYIFDISKKYSKNSVRAEQIKAVKREGDFIKSYKVSILNAKKNNEKAKDFDEWYNAEWSNIQLNSNLRLRKGFIIEPDLEVKGNIFFVNLKFKNKSDAKIILDSMDNFSEKNISQKNNFIELRIDLENFEVLNLSLVKKYLEKKSQEVEDIILDSHGEVNIVYKYKFDDFQQELLKYNKRELVEKFFNRKENYAYNLKIQHRILSPSDLANQYEYITSIKKIDFNK